MPMMNRATAQNVLGSYDMLVEGPDSYSNSALFFGAADGFTFNIANVSGESTICFWIKDLVADTTVWDFDGRIISMRPAGGVFELRINSGLNILDVPLGWSNDDWMFIAINFLGDMVRIYRYDEDMGLHHLNFGIYGGDSTLMNASIGALFDPRILPRRVSEDALVNYYESVTVDKADTGYLPIMR